MIYLISSIKGISHDNIIYSDNDNIDREINLFECSKNWVKYRNGRDYTTWEGSSGYEISIETNKCVGERDWFAEKPYFEFFSNPKIRFEIHPKNGISKFFIKYWRQIYYKEFNKVSVDLEKSGWTTFDLG